MAASRERPWALNLGRLLPPRRGDSFSLALLAGTEAVHVGTGRDRGISLAVLARITAH